MSRKITPSPLRSLQTKITNTQLTRMVFFNIADASTQQYLTLQEQP